jgi:uncharacterized protein YjiS (DUF1127 family)
MQAYVAHSTPAAWMSKVASGLVACAAAVRRNAQRLNAWTLARDKAADDHYALLAMSERELRDIGIDASQIRAVTKGDWVRDWAV